MASEVPARELGGWGRGADLQSRDGTAGSAYIYAVDAPYTLERRSAAASEKWRREGRSKFHDQQRKSTLVSDLRRVPPLVQNFDGVDKGSISPRCRWLALDKEASLATAVRRQALGLRELDASTPRRPCWNLEREWSLPSHRNGRLDGWLDHNKRLAATIDFPSLVFEHSPTRTPPPPCIASAAA